MPHPDRAERPSVTESFFSHVAQTSDRPLGLVVDRAEGPFLYLVDGRPIIDLVSGIAVSSIGHGHPRVLEAIRSQIDRHLHVMVYGEFVIESQVLLAERLADLLPVELQRVYFTNSGAEAVEGALKVAKKYTGRSRLIAFDRSYHGDTHGALSVTGRDIYRKPFEPLLPNVTFLPFNDIDALQQIDRSTAAVIAEPVQGEGGIRVPSDDWVRSLRDRTREMGAVLIFDEIQTGMGRTGSMFAFQQAGVTPDVLCLAKAFGGGMPLGAFISSGEIMGSLSVDPPLSHVTTFGGHPVSCAAALAALNVMLDERLPQRAYEIEKRVRKALAHPRILEVRGRGAMLGMVLASASQTKAVASKALERSVLTGWTLHSDALIRLAPPLNIPFDVLDESLAVLIDSLEGIQE
ncbi:MAG TPA: aspartate aminotransferase family protein [Rhodothermales bacterium]|nr:aspartate aminotransferase family protein [Rhodothermales bacterium]